MKIFDQSIIKEGAVLAVSGGIDSMTMLFFAINQQPKFDFEVVTVNHHIRASAHKDCQLVADYCQANNVKCTIVNIYPQDFANDTKLSLETAARLLRYGALDNIASGRPICLAHNRNDQAETVLMHILRGSGVHGAVGMQTYANNYYRPLLELSRNDIEQIAQANRIPYINDETNSDNNYTRNYIRNKIIPLLSKVNANAVGNIVKFSNACALDDNFFDQMLVQLMPELNIMYSNDSAIINLDVFELYPSLRYRILHKVFYQLGYTYDIEQSHLDAICELANNISGKKINLPFDLIALKAYNSIKICPKNTQKITKNTQILPLQLGDNVYGNYTLTLKPHTDQALRFDYDKLPEGTCIRTRREGDIFTKFGGGTKKLKEYFIDCKIPIELRDQLPLVCHGNEVFIIAGIQISDKIRIDENTINSYTLTISTKENKNG